MNIKIFILLLFTVIINSVSSATTFPTLKVGPSTPLAASSLLEIQGTLGALLIPRMTTTQKNAIPSPVNGDMIYDSTLNSFSGYQNGAWTNLLGTATWGSISGTLSNQTDLQSALNAKQATGNYITALTSDVSASGPGSVSSTVNSVGGSSATNIHSAELAANAATNSNTASTIVKRDASGNFSAGTITASLTGAASLNVLSSALGNLTDAGTDGIVVTGGSGATVGSASLAQHVADTTHNGYLLSTDWNTFNGKQASGNYITALTGDVAASGPGSVSATLATVNSNVGSFGSSTAIPSFTVTGKGLLTAASSSAVIAPAGTLTGTTLASNVVTSSLTSVGTITSGTWTGTTLAIANGGSGQTTANNALNAFLPTQTSNSGKFLTTDGSNTSWGTASAAASLNGASFRHGIDCLWTRSAATYADPTADTSCTFTVDVNNGMGTITSYNDGTTDHNLPGFVFSPATSSSIYMICAYVISQGSILGSVIGHKLWDGTTTIRIMEPNAITASEIAINPICGLYTSTTTSATTIRVQMRASVGTESYGAGTQEPVAWTILQIK